MQNKVLIMEIEEGKNRAFPFIRDVLAFDALVVAAMRSRRGYKAGEDRAATSKMCQAAGMEIMAVLDGYLEAIDTGIFSKTITFETITLPPPSAGPIEGLRSLGSRTEGAIFGLFTELGSDWIKRNLTTDYHRWPPVANFCRVVRNAIVHGKININSQTAPVVRWRNVTISHRDAGQEIFAPTRISAGDLIVLMLELDGELSNLGAPMDLS
jgi:hypothetical protein